MTRDRWLPTGHELDDGARLGRLLYGGGDWQIFGLDTDGAALIVTSDLAERWVAAMLVPARVLGSLTFGAKHYRALVSRRGERLEPVGAGMAPETKADGLSFAVSLRETRKIVEAAPLHDSIFVERYSRLLPTWTVTEGRSDDEVLGRWMTGGVSLSATSCRRVAELLGWLSREEVAEVARAAGLGVGRVSGGVGVDDDARRRGFGGLGGPTQTRRSDSGEAAARPSSGRRFQLAGRRVLEAFFNEHVIDVVENAGQYERLGIGFPTGMVLHGPSGCGKTFAVGRLVEYLDWPSFDVGAGTVGSPYIHETSRKIRATFDRATDAAPSVVVIDEMEAYLTDRQAHGAGLHHVEEVGEFLKAIPEAAGRAVLVIGMTNRLEMIDAAILRRGRFDHVVEVGMPDTAELAELLRTLLAKLPAADGIDTEHLVSALEGRTLADTAFVVREAARLAARAGKRAVDEESLRQAVTRLPAGPTKRSVGFGQD